MLSRRHRKLDAPITNALDHRLLQGVGKPHAQIGDIWREDAIGRFMHVG